MIKEITQYIANSLGMTIGVDLFCQLLVPEDPDTLVLIRETGGFQEYDGDMMFSKDIQVMSRAYNWSQARELIENIHDFLHGTTNLVLDSMTITNEQYQFGTIACVSLPAPIGEDSKGRNIYTAHYLIRGWKINFNNTSGSGSGSESSGETSGEEPHITTIYVRQDGSGDFTNITDAVEYAIDGDTIIVYDGTYNEHVVIDKSITLQGVNKNTCILNSTYDGDAKRPVLTIQNSISVSGFTIVNNYNGLSVAIEANEHDIDFMNCNFSVIEPDEYAAITISGKGIMKFRNSEITSDDSDNYAIKLLDNFDGEEIKRTITISQSVMKYGAELYSIIFHPEYGINTHVNIYRCNRKYDVIGNDNITYTILGT